MRIINRAEFLAMPTGTLYAKYSSLGCWGELSVKEDSTNFNDWFQYDLLNGWDGCNDSNEFMDKVLKCEKGDGELRNDLECSGRDGLYEDNQQFIVYDKNDIKQLISKLKELSI